MRCFSCINTARKRLNVGDEGIANNTTTASPSLSHSSGKNVEVCMDDKQMKNSNFGHSFPLQELVVATNNFRDSHLIGEGGFGKVFKGFLHNGQAIAVKQLNLEGLQGNQEFIIEVFMLSLLHHPNLVTLIGYCAEGNQKLLVYEYMPKGSLADHLFDKKREKEVVDWNTRIKIATGAARGLEHLHCEAKPAVIYRDLKSANILLDDEYNPRLSDFGLAKLGPVGDNTHVTTRVMGTYGYCAPEYVLTGKLTLKSDIFSFGVVLLEIITGKRALDFAKRRGQHNLVAWARLMLKDRRNCTNLVDPKLGGQFPIRSARRMIAIAGMCLNEDPGQRPPVKDIVAALEFLASEPQSPYAAATYNSTGSSNHFQSQRMYSQTNRIGRLVRPINQDLGFAPVCKYRSRISQY